MRRDRNDGDVTQDWLSPDPLGEGQAVFRAKLYIEQNGVGWIHFEGGKALLQILRRHYLEIFRFQPIAKKLSIGRVVLDH
jgi:hypothetical protein